VPVPCHNWVFAHPASNDILNYFGRITKVSVYAENINTTMKNADILLQPEIEVNTDQIK